MLHLYKISRKLCAATSSRLLSSAQAKPLVDVAVDEEGIATVQMQRAPVNSLNPELMQKLHDSIIEVEKKKFKGLVLTSAYPTVFSAGVDLTEFDKPNIKRLELFKESLFDVVAKLFASDLITTIAINGYAGAGACILALACEYRTMTTGKATIGLNDTAVGIPPAKWIVDLMTRTMGARQAEYALASSFMFPAERAFQVGLIDEVATDKTDAVEKCKNFIKTFDNISPAIRAATKRSIRQQYITELERDRKQNVTTFIDMMTSPEIQNKIDQYVKGLRQKKAVKV